MVILIINFVSKDGLRDGISSGKEIGLQKGFDLGFKLSSHPFSTLSSFEAFIE